MRSLCLLLLAGLLLALAPSLAAADRATRPKSLKGAGYATGHFGKWHLGPEPYSPLEHGFDVDVPHWPGPGPAGSYVAPWRFKDFDPDPGQPKQHIEDRMAEEAVAFMEEHKDEPFFLNYWMFSVHAPPVPEWLPPSVTVHRGDWKLIRLFHAGEDGAHRWKLFKLRTDLGEQHDLARREPERVKAMDLLIENFLADTGAVVPIPNPGFNPAAYHPENEGVGKDRSKPKPARKTTPKRRPKPKPQSKPQRPAQDLLVLDNGTTKIGIDRAMGASITWLSWSSYPKNMVNSSDPGRLIQQSYYAGRRLDRTKDGQSKAWSPWSWETSSNSRRASTSSGRNTTTNAENSSSRPTPSRVITAGLSGTSAQKGPLGKGAFSV